MKRKEISYLEKCQQPKYYFRAILKFTKGILIFYSLLSFMDKPTHPLNAIQSLNFRLNGIFRCNFLRNQRQRKKVVLDASYLCSTGLFQHKVGKNNQFPHKRITPCINRHFVMFGRSLTQEVHQAVPDWIPLEFQFSQAYCVVSKLGLKKLLYFLLKEIFWLY